MQSTVGGLGSFGGVSEGHHQVHFQASNHRQCTHRVVAPTDEPSMFDAVVVPGEMTPVSTSWR